MYVIICICGCGIHRYRNRISLYVYAFHHIYNDMYVIICIYVWCIHRYRNYISLYIYMHIIWYAYMYGIYIDIQIAYRCIHIYILLFTYHYPLMDLKKGGGGIFPTMKAPLPFPPPKKKPRLPFVHHTPLESPSMCVVVCILITNKKKKIWCWV